MSKEDGGSAFPQMTYETTMGRNGHFTTEGMALRDWFAGQALAGLCVCPGDRFPGDKYFTAGEAYSIADAMLEARGKKNEEN